MPKRSARAGARAVCCACQVEISPAQTAAMIRRPQSGEDRRQQQQTTRPLPRHASDGPHLVQRRDIDTDFEPELLPGIGGASAAIADERCARRVRRSVASARMLDSDTRALRTMAGDRSPGAAGL